MLGWAGGELSLHPLAPGLRSIEGQSRRAGPRRNGHLQIADVHVEGGDVERRAAVEQRRLRPDFVVPRLLVFPRGVAAVIGQVLGGAQWHVEGIVDAPQAEPAGDLGVQGQRVGHLVARDRAGRHAAGVGLAGVRDQRCAGVVVGKEAVEDHAAVIIEVVVAQAARKIEGVRHAHGRFAEDRGLLRVVRQVGPEQVIHAGPQSLGETIWSAKSGVRQRVKPQYDQVLAVVTFVVAVKATDQPPQAAATAGETRFLRPYLGPGGVIEWRVQLVHVLREAERATGDAAGQGRGIPYHQDVAARVGGDRGQAHPPEIVLQIQVAEHEFIVKRLLDLGELLARA